MQVAEDLKDTLQANSKTCVGMAANMIDVKKQIIIVSLGFAPMIMFNPKIVKKSGEYETEEGCLSLEGLRRVKRYQNITVEYQDIFSRIFILKSHCNSFNLLFTKTQIKKEL